MAYYRGNAGTPDRAKALAAVVVVHAALAAVLLTGASAPGLSGLGLLRFGFLVRAHRVSVEVAIKHCAIAGQA